MTKPSQVFLDAEAAHAHFTKALTERLRVLDTKLVPLNNGVVDGAVVDAMKVVQQKLKALDSINARLLAGDDVSIGEIEVAAGAKKAPKPAAQRPATLTLHQPHDLTSELNRNDYRKRAFARGEADRSSMTAEQKERLDGLSEKYTEDAISHVELFLNDFRALVGNHASQPVAYTLGQHHALSMTFGCLWADLRASVKFNRAERLALEKRIEELEARPALEYRGVFSLDTDYKKGNAVTSDGSLWIARLDSKGIKPGDGTVWTLAAKRGANGKDSR